MSEAIFFRLLREPIDDKGEALAARVAALNAGAADEETFVVAAADLGKIPGSPFAYWASTALRQAFGDFPPLQNDRTTIRVGLQTSDDFRFLRCWFEVPEHTLRVRWFNFAKGGHYAPYFSDVHLVINWEEDGRELKVWADPLYGNSGWSRIIKSVDFYFRPGLTWPRRTNGLSVRALPTGCIFADKGPAVFVANDDPDALLVLAAVMNSRLFGELVRLQLARTELAQSYEVGLIQNTPIPPLDETATTTLAAFARRAHDLQRENYSGDETTHVFGRPALVRGRGAPSLAAAAAAEAEARAARAAELADVQAAIDRIVAQQYGVDTKDERRVTSEGAAAGEGMGDEEEETGGAAADWPALVAELLLWCVGVAFGRWDARPALDPARLPPLPGPFDPLPRVAPGALLGPDGRPATAAPPGYPLAVAWDGVLVDDPGHPGDLVGRVQAVLDLLYGPRAEAIEREACAALGVRELRDYFRDPRRFFADHIRRYSKSRRKAPIYWLLQSARRHYAVWLYYPRIGPETYLQAARDYVDGKARREETTLDELRAAAAGADGAARRRAEEAAERQRAVVDELLAFRKTLDRVGSARLAPDPNDGVLISIAPLHELVPWKEAAATAQALLAGQYAWSTMSRQLRAANR